MHHTDRFVFIKKGEYDRIDNSCFDDRQEAQRTVANVRSKRSQDRVKWASQVIKKIELFVKAKNNILKV